jgi:hypothetical protein
MANSVLVAAKEADWLSLTASSLLPDTMFGRTENAEHRGPFLYTGVEADDPANLSVEALEQVDRLLFQHADSHLVVLFRCSGKTEEDLSRFHAASSSWALLLEERKRRHGGAIRPACIIIGGDSTAGGESGFREFLAGVRNDLRGGIFRDVFLVSPRLEPGGGDIFHARNIWPVSVGRLLLCLASRRPGNDAGGIFAWRFREFRHTEPGLLYERLVPACSDALFDKLRAMGQAAVLPDWLPAQGGAAMEQEKVAPTGFWHTFPAVSEAERSADPARILDRLASAGAADAKKRSASILERWRHREDALEKFWASLHAQAGSAWQTETALQAAERPAVAALGAAADAHLEALSAKVSAVEEAGRSLQTGAAELAVAQSWFVQRLFRLAIAVAAGSLLGIIFFRAAQLYFGNPWMAGVVAAGCFAGALLAAAVFYGLENWRGEEGVKEWRRRKGRYEAALAGLHDHLCELKNNAARLSAGGARVTLHSKLLRLVTRMTSAVAAVFTPSGEKAAPLSVAESGRSGAGLLRYLEKSTVQLGGESRLQNEAELDVVNHAVSLLLGRTDFFEKLTRRWQEVCSLTDAPPKGAVDAAKLHSRFAAQLATLPGEVDRIISASARETTLWQDLNAALEKIYDGAASADLLSVEVSDVARFEPQRELLVSASYAEDRENMERHRALVLPAGAEAATPVLLMEFSRISTDRDLTQLKTEPEVIAR